MCAGSNEISLYVSRKHVPVGDLSLLAPAGRVQSVCADAGLQDPVPVETGGVQAADIRESGRAALGHALAAHFGVFQADQSQETSEETDHN